MALLSGQAFEITLQVGCSSPYGILRGPTKPDDRRFSLEENEKHALRCARLPVWLKIKAGLRLPRNGRAHVKAVQEALNQWVQGSSPWSVTYIWGIQAAQCPDIVLKEPSIRGRLFYYSYLTATQNCAAGVYSGLVLTRHTLG
jgi:hypothetical protein